MRAPDDHRTAFCRLALVAGVLAVPVGSLAVPPAEAAAVSARTAAAALTARAGRISPAPARTAGTRTRPPAGHAGPRLSISVADGRAQAAAGDRLTYTVTVRNAGAAAVRRVTITQTLPPGTRLISASAGGQAAHGRIAWQAAVPAGRAVVFTSSEQVIRIPARQLRLAAVACAALAGSSRPLVCAAALTDTPTTAEAVSRASRPAASAGGGWGGYAAGAAAVAVAGGIAVGLIRRRPGAGRRG
jgi:uncharacterized repeat protein (TIGR01451 family)